MLSFGGNRFTAKVSESYFTSVIRIGIKILFMYTVLAIGMQMVNSLETALLAACHPTTTTLPWITSYWTPPTAMATTVCTGTIALGDIANYAVIACVFAAMCIGIPRMAADLAGGPLGHPLEDLAAAYFIGRSVLSLVIKRGVRLAFGRVWHSPYLPWLANAAMRSPYNRVTSQLF
jgi:hypothetical protein